jgi:hypothetical protein
MNKLELTVILRELGASIDPNGFEIVDYVDAEQAIMLLHAEAIDVPNPAVAAIGFALGIPFWGGSMDFLECWNTGEFTFIRKNWPEAPEEVYIGADASVTPTEPEINAYAAKVNQLLEQLFPQVAKMSMNIGVLNDVAMKTSEVLKR